jgi:undecaprenyl-diphosphatase
MKTEIKGKLASSFLVFSYAVERYWLEMFLLEFLLIAFFIERLLVIVAILVGTITTLLIAKLIKGSVGEKRPQRAILRSRYLRRAFIDPRGFPSYHSAATMFFAVALYKSYLFLPLFLFAASVAYSRHYIGSHHIRDIVAGAIIGAAVGYIFAHFLIVKYI